MSTPDRIMVAAMLFTVVLPTLLPAQLCAQECDIWVVADTPHPDPNIELVLIELGAQGITPLRARNLTDLRERVLEKLDGESCCLRKLYLVGHGAPGTISLFGRSVAPGEHIDGNSQEWNDVLFELGLVRGCPGDRTIHLFGCNVGARCEGSDKLFAIAKSVGATVRAPIDRVVEDDIFSNKLSDYLQYGRWQGATSTMGSPPVCIDSLSGEELRERKKILEQTWYCPCNAQFYTSEQACAAGCPSGLACFTSYTCELAYRNNSWERYGFEPVFWISPGGLDRPRGSDSHSRYDLRKGASTPPRAASGSQIRVPQRSGDFIGVSQPSVLKDTDGYLMWFMGWDNADVWRIGLSRSHYGFDWVQDQANPVLSEGTPGSWDDGSVYNPTVLKDGGTFSMWYTGWSSADKHARIGFATSPDGRSWTKHPGPVLDIGPAGAWDAVGVGAPTVLKEGTQYRMWYEGGDTGGWWRIGYATSPDGITWTKHPSNPVLIEGAPGTWDEWGPSTPAVLKLETTYHLWYAGWDSYDMYRIGHAISGDGILWTKSPENPVLDRAYGDRWDNASLGHPSVVYNVNEAVLEIWYRGLNADATTYGIGFATAPATTMPLGVQEPGTPAHQPVTFYLGQNYPNPFNASARIRFSVPETARATLRVFSVLGIQVASLVDEVLPPGVHTTTFDATALPSGVYFYRLTIGPYTDTKKAVLMK